MTPPDWLARHDGTLRLASDGRTWLVYFDGAPALQADAVAGRRAGLPAVICQTENGKRIDKGATYSHPPTMHCAADWRSCEHFSGGDRGRKRLSGTIRVNGGTYAWTSVISPTSAARTMLCQTTALKMSASLPSWSVAAVATQMLWASIILPMTPPVLLAVQISTCACVQRQVRAARRVL